MAKKLFIILLLLILGFFVISQENIKIILSGIAIFLIGMHFMEDGFKQFSGGTLEEVLERFTSNKYKSLLTGFISTSIVQSSSLISVIIISFLSVGLISLTQAVAVVFGSNLGSTTTAWIVSSFGLNIKISLYAMPLIIFGVIFRFSKNSTYLGIGNVFLGLGFIFLGISYMKEGFDTLKDSIDLAAYSVDGFIGLMLFIIIGMIMTIVIQSSSAAMAIVITALAGGNILYLDALALAIGANIGTTVTAVMGALTSNQNGKRLAFVHFIFNGITGLLALVLIYQLKDLVDIISLFIGIDDENYSMKLALFHTIFNLLGIVVLFPFIALIVKLSEKIINDDKMRKESRPLYLDMANLKLPYNAMISIQKEVINLYDKAQKALLHALSIHTKDLVKREDIDKILKNKPSKIDTNLDEIYKNNLKELYSEIIEYSLLSQENMTKEQHEYVAQLKIASNVIVKILKDTRDIQKNMDLYLNSKNEFVKKEYLDIKGVIVNTIFSINQLKDSNHDEVEISTIIQMDKDKLQDFELMYSERIDNLIRSEKITSKMATSLINDSTTVFNICRNLYRIANILFIKDEKLRMLGDIDNETEKNI
ncbi:hypothetical protein GCM10012288_09420 [Malaciobacter pacificus]|uniref:Sodium:phosphate symporter n=1 Tax=Malaciobacter pacificus TaxID=1080223 RepID=A0A5C2H8R3_9BACT|nr:Na/Pi cotransporter family protein [Malaciobacter pacificus]QEP34608.1 sodium:phosphate symporter [Malaciobacter pacificus]GGD37395.1 hypothetical protein GCM10012288_09420 [Malaciobacter pacificus]